MIKFYYFVVNYFVVPLLPQKYLIIDNVKATKLLVGDDYWLNESPESKSDW